MTIKTDSEIEKMQIAGRIVEDVLLLMQDMIRPGVKTMELNRAAEALIRSKNAVPSFLHYQGFPYSICVSVNEQVVHGFPEERTLVSGDIVSVDVGAQYDGFHGDAARTFAVGEISEEAEQLINVTRECFFKGLAFAREGYRVGDISAAIEAHALAHGYGVVRELVGHGVGHQLHEPPDVPNYGKAGHGPRLLKGMTIAVEPMINQGGREVYVLDNGWTVVTRDGKYSAHYENTIAITDDAPILLTLTQEEECA